MWHGSDRYEEGTNQFAAMIALPRTLSFLDLGLRLTFGNEERFFFFCSSRPMIAGVAKFLSRAR